MIFNITNNIKINKTSWATFIRLWCFVFVVIAKIKTYLFSYMAKLLKKDILNEFNKIFVNKANYVFDIINKNINNDNHNMIKKYQSIVKFIKSYKDNYNDELDIFVDDIKNLDLDEFLYFKFINS